MLESTLAEKYTGNQEGLSQTKYGHKQDDWPEITGISPHYHKTQDCEPRGRAVLLGPLTCLLSIQAPLPHKVFYFVSMCVSLDKSFPAVRQEPPSCNKHVSKTTSPDNLNLTLFLSKVLQ